MILLITPSARSQECGKEIETATTHPTHIATSLGEAISHLRSGDYTAVILDECLLDADPDQGELVLQHAGSATRVYINCAISGTERVVREVRHALRRRQQEERTARKAAEETVRCELREQITAILLELRLGTFRA